ncbi:MAG: cyclodeaminase/cyclohydrolase family protein, partial [Staphylococcus equorum]|nr:cyclodeaminase/cyclohydrolase family protein [Staphylococcus equorum]
MEDETISAYLTELGAKDGSYGGGSTAAYMGAMSASLVRKVIDIQKDKSRYLENENEMKELLKESE